jgi:hypothetical protein
LLALVWGVFACDLAGTPVDPGAVAGAAAGCPDLGSAAAAAKVDWAGMFELEAKKAAKIRSGVVAALELKALSGQIDADLRTACGGIAKDLTGATEFKNGKEACDAAIKALGDARAEIGANAKLAVDIVPPRCSASLDAYANCVAECEVDVEPGSVKVECEGGELVGRCDAECTGTCHMAAAAKCEGTCEGSCSAQFSGSCGGSCTGKCDGKSMNGGSCAGKCEGSCSAQASGSCGGNCEGSCKLSGSAKCSGECQGSCSVDFEAPRCTGEVKPPQASAECQASCDAKVSAKLECEPAQIAVRIEGSADAQAAIKYKATLERNLPKILKVAVGMKDQALKAAANVKVVVEGLKSVVASLKGAGTAGARLAACVAAPFQAALQAAASIKVNVEVSVEVQASASASGSASGSAGG